MVNIKKQILEQLQKAVKEVTGIDTAPVLTTPSDSRHGDYTTNIAMTIFKKNQESGIRNQEIKTPYELAVKIKDQFLIHNSKFIILDSINVVAPGFINFYLSKEFLIRQLYTAAPLRPPEAGFAGQRKIMVEFTDPNPFKEFHIGHLYSNAVGESLSRLLESQGAKVWRVTYQGDVGLHVAKALYGIINHEVGIKNYEGKSLEEKVKFLGEAYAKGAKAYEKDAKAKEEIHKLNKMMYEKDPSILGLYEKGRAWSLEYFETMYKRLGSTFVKNYFESVAGPIGLELVKEHIKDDVFKESEGAVIFPGEKYGLHNRVFINSLGLPTYEAKELGLAPTKYQDFPYDLSVVVTGNEINAYFKVILKALSLINPDLAAKTRHISHGMVRLPGGKMSSRTGNVITGQWLLDEAKKKIKANFKDMDEQILEIVAVGAVKYSLLKFSIGSDISFSFEESVSLEGNSGPYIQYAFARTQSVIRKSRIMNHELRIKNYELNGEEVQLLRTLYRFAEVVESAAEYYAPHVVCNYLFELAQQFNLFYQKHQIIGTEAETQNFRLALAEKVGYTLKTGLYLLGIKSPEKM